MKYWCGYLVAAIFGAFSWVLLQFGEKYQMLVDMVYPYVTKTLQGMLTQWSSGVDFLVWQTIVVIFLILVISTLILYLILKGNLIQWFGWVLSVVSVVFFLNTAVYGLNDFAGPITEDLRIEQTDYTLSDLKDATIHYRDKAGQVAVQMSRDEQGTAVFSDFDTLAQRTGNGFRNLMLDMSFSIYGGDHTPVKKLTGMKGVDGITVPLTGESAVNPDIAPIALPFTMAREMTHRMSISREDEANFSAFLACMANDDPEYQYSGYFMAYLYTYNTLASIDPAAAEEIHKGSVKELTWDFNQYNQYVKSVKNEKAVRLMDQANGAYRKVSGTDPDKRSDSTVSDLLVCWYLDQFVIEEVPEVEFDPYDETQVDLTGIVNAKPTEAEGAA